MKRSRMKRANANVIPDESRALVEHRDNGLCAACGLKGSDLHHRRSRRVIDEHTHCPCNLVTLCRTDHQWAHLATLAGPGRRQVEAGLVVTQWQDVPSRVAFRSPQGVWWAASCDGLWVPLSDEHVTEGTGGAPMVLQGVWEALSER